MNFLTSSLYTLLSFAFALGVIIVVHEAGHLLMAKAFGVRVLTFSVGFGKRLWGFQRGRDRVPRSRRSRSAATCGWGARAPRTSIPSDPREFLNKPRWQRVLVYLAGPAANIILAILVFAIVFMVGIEVMNLPDMPAADRRRRGELVGRPGRLAAGGP